MSIPLSTITSFRTAFSPFSQLSRPCRVLATMLQTASTVPGSSPTHIKVSITHLPRDTKQLPELTVGYKNGKELRLEVGKKNMSVTDVLEEVGRVGRVIEREESLKG